MTQPNPEITKAIQGAMQDGFPVFGWKFGMIEHPGSKRRYVVLEVDLGNPTGTLNFFAPGALATHYLRAFGESEQMARTGIVQGTALPDALAQLKAFGQGLNGQPN